MSMQWVRLWHDMPTDPKWRVIARKSGQTIPSVIAVYTMMMVNASEAAADERGCLSGFDSEDVAAALDMLPDDVDAILDAMQGKVLDGRRLSGWSKRQPKRERDDSSTDRVRAHRQRQKTNETPCNATKRHVTPPDTEADTDTEVIEANASCASGDAPALTTKHVMEFWNEVAPSLGKPAIRKLTPSRQAKVRSRIAQNSLEDFQTVFANIRASPFLRGDRGWNGCTFDWAFKAENFQKILEGNYNG